MAIHSCPYPCLGKPTDRGAWQATVHGVVRIIHDLANKQQQMAMNLCHAKCALSSPSHPLVRTLRTCSQPFSLAGCRVLTPLNLVFSLSLRTIFVNHPLTFLNVIPFSWCWEEEVFLYTVFQAKLPLACSQQLLKASQHQSQPKPHRKSWTHPLVLICAYF